MVAADVSGAVAAGTVVINTTVSGTALIATTVVDAAVGPASPCPRAASNRRGEQGDEGGAHVSMHNQLAHDACVTGHASTDDG